MRHFWLSFVASTIVLCGLLSGPFTPRPVAATDTAQRAQIAGTVVDGAGKPVQGAAMRVLYAWTRVRSTPHCASCWADCGKTAISDTAGGFKIESLDPQLVFRVLVVAKGYEPEVVHLIDPQKDEPLNVTLKARRALPKDSRQILSGHVIDSHGKPIAGALVEPFGCKEGDKRWWGEMQDADPLAVTDVQGRFDIIANHPLDGIDLKVTARAMAEKNFALVPTAKTDNRLSITEGATVRGRIVDHGRPAAGVIVRLAKPERWRETLVGQGNRITICGLALVPARWSLENYWAVHLSRALFREEWRLGFSTNCPTAEFLGQPFFAAMWARQVDRRLNFRL